MNFTDVVSEIISITKRPDKIEDIRREVNACLTKTCAVGNFSQDIEEDSIAISSSAYAQSLPLSSFTRFRKFKALKPLSRNKYLCPTAPNKLFAENLELLDRYYIAGSQVTFKLSVLDTALMASWYAYPPILTDAAPDFWLLEVNPWLIIEGAAGCLFKSIGDDSSYKTHEGNYRELLDIAIRDLRYGVNYG